MKRMIIKYTIGGRMELVVAFECILCEGQFLLLFMDQGAFQSTLMLNDHNNRNFICLE